MNPCIRAVAVAVAALLLGACNFKPKTFAVSYGAVNHTDVTVVAIIINGEGGVLSAMKHGEGGGVCCVVVPEKWTPGLSVTIKWREDGHYLEDENGNEVKRDGVPVLIEAPWKSRTVPVPRYEGEGDFFVFFFPGDDVRVALTSSPEFHEWHAETPEDKVYSDEYIRELHQR